MAKKHKIIAPELKKVEDDKKVFKYFYRNLTLDVLREAFPYKQNLWHVSQASLVSKEAIDEYREDSEAELLNQKRVFLESAGWSYTLMKVKR